MSEAIKKVEASRLDDGSIGIVMRDGSYVAEFRMSYYPEGTTVLPPGPAKLTPRAAQELVDCLAALGFSPTTMEGLEGALEAQERHLQDMRAITFHTLGIEKP